MQTAVDGKLNPTFESLLSEVKVIGYSFNGNVSLESNVGPFFSDPSVFQSLTAVM